MDMNGDRKRGKNGKMKNRKRKKGCNAQYNAMKKQWQSNSYAMERWRATEIVRRASDDAIDKLSIAYE